jgi:HTH-type transcriptional regulator / antitoxin MqsA
MKLVNGMVCPVCEVGHLEKVIKNVPFKYKGHEHIVANVKGYDCNVCGESLWDDRDEKAIEKSLTDVRREIDGLLTSDEIKKIRQLFGMTQMQFSEALKVGAKNFARYESGQATQGRSMDHLLRILREYPYTMQVLCGGSGLEKGKVGKVKSAKSLSS